MNVNEWKKQMEEDVRKDVFKYLGPEFLKTHEAKLSSYTAESLGSEVEVTFASDDKIQEMLDGKVKAEGLLCCLTCVTVPLLGSHCVLPAGIADCDNMCL